MIDARGYKNGWTAEEQGHAGYCGTKPPFENGTGCFCTVASPNDWQDAMIAEFGLTLQGSS